MEHAHCPPIQGSRGIKRCYCITDLTTRYFCTHPAVQLCYSFPQDSLSMFTYVKKMTRQIYGRKIHWQLLNFMLSPVIYEIYELRCAETCQSILENYHYLTVLSSDIFFNTCSSHCRGQEWILSLGLVHPELGYLGRNDLFAFLIQ